MGTWRVRECTHSLGIVALSWNFCECESTQAPFHGYLGETIFVYSFEARHLHPLCKYVDKSQPLNLLFTKKRTSRHLKPVDFKDSRAVSIHTEDPWNYVLCFWKQAPTLTCRVRMRQGCHCHRAHQCGHSSNNQLSQGWQGEIKTRRQQPAHWLQKRTLPRYGWFSHVWFPPSVVIFLVPVGKTITILQPPLLRPGKCIPAACRGHLEAQDQAQTLLPRPNP